MKKRDIQSEIIIGIIAGVFSGLILILSQSLVNLYELPYAWMVAISIFFLVVMVLVFAIYNTIKEKQKN